MFDKIHKETLKRHTEELVSLSLEVARSKRVIKELSEQNQNLFKQNWHLSYKLTKLMEAMQLDWQDNKIISKRKKK